MSWERYEYSRLTPEEESDCALKTGLLVGTYVCKHVRYEYMYWPVHVGSVVCDNFVYVVGAVVNSEHRRVHC